ncbi:MAG: hypothetical protein AAF639_37725 [Chloroflexota bacterium]
MANSIVNRKSNEEIKKYWTPERMRNATPISFQPSKSLKTDSVVEPDAPPRTSPGYDPTAPKEITSEDGVSFVASATRVPDPTAYPWRTVGKLYFTVNGQDRSGSAATIYKNTILTAAHNLKLNGQWSDNFLFVPAKTGDDLPYGVWAWAQAHVMPEWNVSENDAYDVGILWMQSGGIDDEPIGDSVGYLGYTVNRTVPREWTDVGYPSNYGNARYMYKQPGMYTRSMEDGRIVGKEGDMAEGTSGGPWLIPPVELNYVNGIHSFGDDRYPDEVFSPYFRTSIGNFINEHLH